METESQDKSSKNETQNETKIDQKEEHMEIKDTEGDEPEGRHMELLRQAINRTTTRCLAAGRFSLFAKLHPSMVKKNVKAIQCIHKQYTERLKDAVYMEVEKMCEEEQMAGLMNELTRMISESSPDAPSWRPSGDVEQDLRAHLIPIKIKTKERLERILENAEEENLRLTRTVTAIRQNCAFMEEEMKKKGDQFDKVREVDLSMIEDFMTKMSRDEPVQNRSDDLSRDPHVSSTG